MPTQPISFTVDLEDHLGKYEPEGRWVANSNALLDFCAAHNIKGTFFAVGRAIAAPDLLRRVVKEGHELGLHSHDHVLLPKEDPDIFRPKLEAAKRGFEDATGVAVWGFRAPQFSLTPKSVWVVDVLKSQGFRYSSSIIAGKGPFHGFPGKTPSIFQWKNGLWEIPVPAASVFGRALPFLGGVYLKFMPLSLVHHLQSQLPAGTIPWTYVHPYDIDAKEGFVRLKDGTPLWANILLMSKRSGFIEKLGRLMKDNNAGPLIKRLPVR